MYFPSFDLRTLTYNKDFNNFQQNEKKIIFPEAKYIQGFPSGSDGKQCACNAGDLGLVPDLDRSPGGRHDNPLEYSCLENLHGQRSLAGYNLWGLKESDITE